MSQTSEFGIVFLSVLLSVGTVACDGGGGSGGGGDGNKDVGSDAGDTMVRDAADVAVDGEGDGSDGMSDGTADATDAMDGGMDTADAEPTGPCGPPAQRPGLSKYDEKECDNKKDDDGDGQTDCFDPECHLVLPGKCREHQDGAVDFSLADGDQVADFISPPQERTDAQGNTYYVPDGDNYTLEFDQGTKVKVTLEPYSSKDYTTNPLHPHIAVSKEVTQQGGGFTVDIVEAKEGDPRETISVTFTVGSDDTHFVQINDARNVEVGRKKENGQCDPSKMSGDKCLAVVRNEKEKICGQLGAAYIVKAEKVD